ncbi:MAG: FAD binding domain-containing protein [Gemmatimonadaceae bacterium]
MRAFTYHRPASLEDAVASLARPHTHALGGGTDLLPCVEDGVATPSSVVDLRAIRGLDLIETLPEGGLRMAAAARIADIAASDLVRSRFPVLAAACDAVGTPALRNMGTLGGSLCQRPRCWYFRRGIACLKNGGATCPAHDGENQYHAILDGGPCYIVHPSDPAVALTALDADVEITGPDGTSRIPITQFFVLPRDRMDSETVLRQGEMVSAVIIPAAFSETLKPSNGQTIKPSNRQAVKQIFRKLTQRSAWDFALVSIAATRRSDGAVRLVLGGVAPRPWRVSESVEEDVASGGLDDDSIAALVDRALYDAEPLSKNGYKVALAASLLREAITELSA